MTNREAQTAWSVLVVDDDDEARELFADVLTVEGFAVSTSINGARALDRLRVIPGRCLILLDLNMPVMSGHDFLLRLAEIPKSGVRFPVLVISGDPDAKQFARMPGVMGVLSKPLPPNALIEAVREHVTPVVRSMR